MLPDESGSFGNGEILEWLINPPNLPADVDPVHAVASAIFQHLVAHGIKVAAQAKGWTVKEFAYQTGSIGYSSWDNVLNGRSLLRADHIGAATVVLKSSGFLPTPQTSQEHLSAHIARVKAARSKPPGIVSSWKQLDSLEDGWTALRRQLAYPRYGPGPEPYEPGTPRT